MTDFIVLHHVFATNWDVVPRLVVAFKGSQADARVRKTGLCATGQGLGLRQKEMTYSEKMVCGTQTRDSSSEAEAVPLLLMAANLPKDKKIILFDGVCNLCDGVVQFIIRHDRKDVFRFAPIQSPAGEEIVRCIGADTAGTDSILLYDPEENRYYYKSEAAIKIAVSLGRIYSVLGIFSVLPKFLTDQVYDYIARNRYRWYGRKAECMIPTQEIKEKFLG